MKTLLLQNQPTMQYFPLITHHNQPTFYNLLNRFHSPKHLSYVPHTNAIFSSKSKLLLRIELGHYKHKRIPSETNYTLTSIYYRYLQREDRLSLSFLYRHLAHYMDIRLIKKRQTDITSCSPCYSIEF